MKQQVIARKIKRLERGLRPRVLDLFSGCGGLSLGFLAAGYEIAAAVELDEHAAASHGHNFHPGDTNHSVARDITATSPRQLVTELGLGDEHLAFDVIVGGPPCQAFARVGRSKLREVADHPEAFRHDPRSRLYIDYLNYVDECAPLAVVLENVPDMLNFGGRNIAQEVCEVLKLKGYSCGYSLLNAAHYGVPQLRDRAILIAVRKELTDSVLFPNPTHWIELPPGYEGTRAVARKLLSQSETLGCDEYWVESATAAIAVPNAITAEEAIGDLPKIHARAQMESGKLKRGARRFDDPIAFPEPKNPSSYAKDMRNWPSFEGSKSIYDHVIRYLPRDYELFARLEPGDQYPEAYQKAMDRFVEAVAERRNSGHLTIEGSEEWTALKSSIVPPYDHTKFPNKWRKMEADQPARTLLAHLEKDGYTHIHYDSDQARTISVREAARLQSFPDGFVFKGTMNPAFRQIGNAVPPLLAREIAKTLAIQVLAYDLHEPQLHLRLVGER